MTMCEKCWGDAYLRMLSTGKSQGDCYFELLEERKNNPCSEKDQSGQFWNEENQEDTKKSEAMK